MKIDFLDGLSLGKVQKSGPMTVVPLLGEDATKNLASFNDIQFNKVVTYGEMNFSNNSEKPFILPSGYAIMTKQLAQDHALVYSTILPGECQRTIESACCIQETQCGYIDGKGIKHFNFLPIEIRKNSVLKHTNNNSYHFEFSRLWPIISKFQKDLLKNGVGNLILYFNKYMDKLASYNAEFETVNGQRGAIILYNNEIVGIEIAPTQEYWKHIWNPLIRDAYGSTILKNSLMNPTKSFESSIDNSCNLENCKSADDIMKELNNLEFSNKIKIFEKINEFSDKNDFIEFKDAGFRIDETQVGKLTHIIAKSESSAIVDFYKENNKIIYLSMLA